MTEPSRRFSIYHTTGTIGAIAAFIVADLMDGGDISGFLKGSSFVLVVGVPFFLLLAGFGRDFLRFIPDAFKTLFTTPGSPNPVYAEIAKYGSRYALGTGVLGVVVGLIEMLRRLDDPGNMGPAIAAAFIAIFYAVILSEMFFAFLYKAYSVPATESNPPSKTGLLLTFCMVLVLALTIFIILYAMSTVLPQNRNTVSSSQEAHYVEMKPFETNIGDPLASHVIRFTPCLVVSDPSAAELITRQTPLIRDHILKSLGSIPPEQFASTNACEVLKTTIQCVVNGIIQNQLCGSVTHVLISDYMVR